MLWESSAIAQKSASASETFSQWLDRHRSSIDQLTSQPELLQEGIALAERRSQELQRLMEADPKEFLNRLLPQGSRDILPAQIKEKVEKPVKGRGFYGVYCVLPPEHTSEDLNHNAGGCRREVILNGKHYRAFVFGQWRDQLTTPDIEMDGVALDDSIVLNPGTPSQPYAPSAKDSSANAPSALGPNTLLYIIAQFADETNDPITEVSATGQMTVVSNFWFNNSGGMVWLQGLVYSNAACDFVHIRLPQPRSYGPTYNNNFAQLLLDARTAASAQGYAYTSYNLDAVVTASQGFSYAGRSYIGGQGSHWVTPYTSLRTAGHELGHNLGLWHANYWRSDSTHPFGKDSNPGGYVADVLNGEWVEYGNYFSVMSAQFGGEWDDPSKPHYSVVEKARLGWLTGSEVLYVNSSGTYRLYRHDAPNTTGTPRAIRVEPSATDYTGNNRRYWLQYRYAPWSTAQNWYRNGLEIEVSQPSYGSDGAVQLDLSPFTKDQSSPFYSASSPPGNWWTLDNCDKLDGALLIGRTFEDSSAGIHITPIAAGNQGSGEEYIDAVINLGTFAGNRAPVISALNLSGSSVSVNQVVSFKVDASDPDSDTLAYSWDFDDGQVWNSSGLNSSTSARSWANPGQYRVLVSVSDMKGGLTSISALVTVGSPASTNMIMGRILWAGHPVAGARISTVNSNSVLQSWTEANGTYTLTDLPVGNYSVTCSFAGLTFSPQFTNPVRVEQSVYGIDFYANETWSGGTLPGLFSVSGQVLDPVAGVPDVELRGGGMVAITDSSGYFQFKNFSKGSFQISPQRSGWSFSPALRTVSINMADSSGNTFSRAAPWSISGKITGVPTAAQDPPPMVYLSNGRSTIASRAGSGANRYWAYTLNNVPAGKFSISAELVGFKITPANFGNPIGTTGNVTGIDFTGSALAGNVAPISGRITQFDVPVPDATVTALRDGNLAGTAQTDSDGCFRIPNLESAAYTLTASKTGHTFDPATICVSSVPFRTGNFAATGPTPPPDITAISATPALLTTSPGTTLLSASSGGAGELTYAWDAITAPGPVIFGTNDSTGASSTTATLQFPGSYTFRVTVRDTNGFASRGTVSVTVNAPPGILAVSPFSTQLAVGQSVVFHADAWDELGNPILLSPSWSVEQGGTVDNAGVFTATIEGGPYAVIAEASGMTATGLVYVTSAPSSLTAPTITSQPSSLAAAAGSNVNFQVTASGSSPLSYQWRLNGFEIAAATESKLTRLNVQSADAGLYTVVVANASGRATSAVATLTVNNPPVLAPLPNRVVHAGSTVAITNIAADPDLPGQSLAFSLESGSPPGISVNSTNGLVSWSPGLSSSGTTSQIGIRVTDNGIPQLSDTKTFSVTVIEGLSIQEITWTNNTAILSWKSAPGTTYRVEHKDSLADEAWQVLAPTVTATGAVTSFTNGPGLSARFYRLAIFP